MMWNNTSFKTEPYGTRGIYFYEPIETIAPEDAQPYCCYINTVIFYEKPFPGDLVEIETVHTQWDLFGKRFSDELEGLSGVAPFVRHEGELYELSGGHTTWRNGRWYMKWLAFRVSEDDRRWPYIPTNSERGRYE